METRSPINKATAAVTSAGAILLSVFCILPLQSVEAGVVDSGTAVLADSLGTATGPEALTVNYQVSLSGGIYTYSYTLNNPAGDVLLPPNSGSEVVDQFSLDFNAALLGAVLPGTLEGSGTSIMDHGAFGVEWLFNTPLTAGSSSDSLSFESDFAPTFGNATASDANAPSPWAASPNGSLIALPGSSVPDAASTVTLFSGALVLLSWGKSRMARFSS